MVERDLSSAPSLVSASQQAYPEADGSRAVIEGFFSSLLVTAHLSFVQGLACQEPSLFLFETLPANHALCL